MSYTRLTRKADNGKPYFDGCLLCDLKSDCGLCPYWESGINRLAELEDKIEQGKLIELPCKVGDTVCKFYKVENGIKIYSGTVTKIEMRKNGIMIYITNLPNFYYEKAFVGDLTNNFIDTTCYYFCPVEEAEARLKEMQNAKRK